MSVMGLLNKGKVKDVSISYKAMVSGTLTLKPFF
jgi:hypothetical protein